MRHQRNTFLRLQLSVHPSRSGSMSAAVKPPQATAKLAELRRPRHAPRNLPWTGAHKSEPPRRPQPRTHPLMNLGPRGQPGLNSRRIQIAQAFHHAHQSRSGQVKTRPHRFARWWPPNPASQWPPNRPPIILPQHPLMRPHPECTLISTAVFCSMPGNG